MSQATGKQSHIELIGKRIDIDISAAASQALAARSQPLNVEMELYFSCLIRKKVRFHDNAQPGDTRLAAQIQPKLQLRFRPVMTRSCGRDYAGDEPPLTDFPIANPKPYVPHWLHIDYHNGEWQGDVGYGDAD